MGLVTQALIALIVCLCVVVSELLARHTPLRLLGTALLVILLGLAVANLGLIPTRSTPEAPVPIYGGVFAWVAPLSIFWLLLRVELRRVLEAGLAMVALFVVGSLGTVLGAVLGMALIGGAPALGEHASHVAGMYVGTYTGGSINFNAIALHYGVAAEGVVFAGAVAVDNVLTAVWMVGCLMAPRWLRRVMPKRERARPPAAEASEASRLDTDTRAELDARDRETLDPLNLAVLLALGLVAWLASQAAAEWAAGLGFDVPAMLILTVLALVLAQLRPQFASLGRRLGLGDGDPFAGASVLGMFAVYVFLVVVGAHADLAALWAIGELGLDLTILAATTITVHGVLVFAVAAVFRLDFDAAAVASQANIGGGTTALALARGLGRDELAAPGILVGSLGTALGTFLGFWIAASL